MTISEWLGEDNQLGVNIWHKKYQQYDESFEHWLNRVSGGNKAIKEMIRRKEFLFGGRILANRGLNKNGVTLSNCYVLSTDDSIEDIYKTCAIAARTMSYGGGVGIDISPLRPSGAKVNNSAVTTTGAVSFMQTFSNVSETIGQHNRRGALMLSIDINHPDVTEFISIKNDLNKVLGANISVRVNDEFMRAVEENKDYILRWPCNHIIYNHKIKQELESIGNIQYNELISYNIEGKLCYYKKIKAKELFHQLCENNWNYAEPGILYWDTIENWNLLSEDSNFKYAGVNPCQIGAGLKRNLMKIIVCELFD